MQVGEIDFPQHHSGAELVAGIEDILIVPEMLWKRVPRHLAAFKQTSVMTVSGLTLTL